MINRLGGNVRTKRWASLALAGGTMAAALTISTTSANAAAATINVNVGGDAEVSGVIFEGMRFLAPAGFTVHKGDTVNFVFQGFHTATLLPVGENPIDWRAEHQAPLSGDYTLVVPDSDDGPTQFMLNNAAVLPSDPNCGTTTTPCAYDGKAVVNSGAPFAAQSFAATINANVGDTVWVVCLIHPDMQFPIKVVADAETTTTQAAVDAYETSQTAADHESAAALIPKLQTPSKHTTSSGNVVWDAFAGFDQDGYGLDGMFPKRLVIAKGERVRWHFSQLMGNIHTVTFPKSEAVSLSNQFGTPVCEADPTDTPPDAPPPAFCSSGPQNLEFHVPAQALLRAGTTKYDGTGFHSSGVEGPGTLGSSPFTLKFTKRSGKIGWKYACIIHGGMMRGKVVVK